MPTRSGMRTDYYGVARIEARTDALRRKVAEAIGDDAERFVPVDTGELKASIGVFHTEHASFVVVGTDHWIYPEYGTRFMAAEPYMRPALYRNRSLGGL